MSSHGAPPRVAIELDGQALDPQDARALTDIRVQQRLSLPVLCELRFLDPAGRLANGPPAAGSSMRVVLEEDNETLFSGDLTACEFIHGPSHGLEVRIRGYDPLHRLRKRQPVRTHIEVTVAEIASELVADLGLSVESSGSAPLWDRLIQFRQSDLEFLAETAERSGLFFVVHGSVLHLMDLGGIDAPIPLELGFGLLEARVEINGDSVCRSVSALGWNPLRAESLEGLADSSRIGRDVDIHTDPDRLGGTGERLLADVALQTEPAAEAVAQALLDTQQAREVVFSGVADGSPLLRPGRIVDVSGLAESFCGRYVVTEVDHTIDNRSGYVTRLSSSPPPPRRMPWGTVMTFGLVKRVDDPDQLGRVQVTLPTYAEVESGWMSVVSAAAGRNKGLTAIPDVGDRVLVLFAREDPAQGVVVGGLYGTEGPPDAGVDGSEVKRFTFLTPDGQKLQLDDSRNAVRLENGDGSFIDMSPDKTILHSARQLEIEAPGNAVIVRGQSIDFEQA